MDALLMCGGRGTRLDAPVEKPLCEVCGRPMVDRVRAALAAGRVETVYAVGSPNAPATLDHLDEPVIRAPGEGYVADLQYALDRVETPVLTAAADLPLLDATVVDRVLGRHRGGSLTVFVPVVLKRLLGVSVDDDDRTAGGDLAHAGLNVVGGGDGSDRLVSYDARLAVNVNRQRDRRVAERLDRGGRGD